MGYIEAIIAKYNAKSLSTALTLRALIMRPKPMNPNMLPCHYLFAPLDFHNYAFVKPSTCSHLPFPLLSKLHPLTHLAELPNAATVDLWDIWAQLGSKLVSITQHRKLLDRLLCDNHLHG